MSIQEARLVAGCIILKLKRLSSFGTSASHARRKKQPGPCRMSASDNQDWKANVDQLQGSILCRRSRCFVSITPRVCPYAHLRCHDSVDSHNLELDRAGRLIWVVTTQHIHKTPAKARDRTTKICRSFHHSSEDDT